MTMMKMKKIREKEDNNAKVPSDTETLLMLNKIHTFGKANSSTKKFLNCID